MAPSRMTILWRTRAARRSADTASKAVSSHCDVKEPAECTVLISPQVRWPSSLPGNVNPARVSHGKHRRVAHHARGIATPSAAIMPGVIHGQDGAWSSNTLCGNHADQVRSMRTAYHTSARCRVHLLMICNVNKNGRPQGLPLPAVNTFHYFDGHAPLGSKPAWGSNQIFGGPRAVMAVILEGHAPSWPGTTMDCQSARLRTRRRACLQNCQTSIQQATNAS